MNKKLVDYSENIRNSVNADVNKGISLVLLSKILLGPLGCLPAYDRFFKHSIKAYKIASGYYGLNSLKALAKFYDLLPYSTVVFVEIELIL
ncbi:hypothetical protein, partial [Histophilus somni]|uniref:hypothetical protein n=1 Tax=Histophilus somni TaxID=731 RepID=UPI001B347700